MSGKRIVVAMSGGVDSSVAAALLKERGFDVVGLFMRNGVKPGEAAARGKQGCCSLDDSMDARRVAADLEVPFYAVNFAADFGRIMNYFVDEYARGRTPNPCIECNRELKFGRLVDYADEIGAEYVATGHYARVVDHAGRRAIARGRDADKDQSYVLYPLEPEQLARTMLPLGEMTKSEVRAEAARFGLTVAEKAESQEICFVPSGKYGDVIESMRPGSIAEGDIVDRAGEKLGRHGGHQLYTIGQRRGLGIAAPAPLYVIATEPETNRVVVGGIEDVSAGGAIVGRITWSGVDRPAPGEAMSGAIQIRYLHRAVPAIAQGEEDGRVTLRFSEPIPAVTPGQAAVFYDGDVVLFGGTIDEALPVAP